MLVKSWMKVFAVISLLLLLVTVPVLSACGGGAAVEEEEEVVTEEEVDEFSIVQDAVADYLPDKAGNTKASDLNMMIAEGDAPYIVSLRKAEDYAKGHIPGAVNKGFGDLATLPENEEILVYCYTGQSASFGAAVLGVLDYDVQNLLHGMSSWSDDSAVYVTRFDAASHQGDYDVETASNAAGSYDYPELENTASNDADDIVAAAAATVSPKYITASDLNMKIAEGDDMTIISVRSAEHYAAFF